MPLVDRIKHHWWWLSAIAGVVLERVLAAFTSLDILGKPWDWLSSPVSFSLPIGVPVVIALVLALLGFFCIRLKGQRDALKNPARPKLASTQERVLFWITKIYDSTNTGEGPTPRYVSEASEIPLIEIETVLDVLKKCGFVWRKKLRSDPISLTGDAREYMSQPSVKARYHYFQTR